ncbi:hypothetical protein BCV72DRAFT_309542 [Rhizopus microsporus var. microsporus]|uniref:Uncharacterized protein n=2 Tax=Rhizopus microsporus TaxID=58291 RepID=A0A2G4T148_RHIZD|nr:uncharacterized protein RHIMIDRAFT_235500 [Rhizopus microsporus ATCC 52813]ORE01972.1 hypothetical protein BCV72DRAFT_309542 [Rhizopus microsporus var. microsporus]PHZ14742.1 hypothetical protein RHIMIDRAFT_235500 [Rhizopus microsporus ATCC 52813]
MLNPLANEFKPVLAESSSSKKDKERRHSNSHHKAGTGDNSKKQPLKDNTSNAKKQGTSKKKGNSSSKKQKPETNKRRPSRQETTSLEDQFKQEAKFIAIETAINPMHRNEKQLEHGYERYIDWINRSLKLYDIITVVGMDTAIVDVVSIVTILQDRKLGVHEEIETFTMDQGNGRKTSCIQVKLHSYF